jgi:TolA-binding protein
MKNQSAVYLLLITVFVGGAQIGFSADPAPVLKKTKKVTAKPAAQPKKGSTVAVEETSSKPTAVKRTSLQVWLSRLKKKVARAESKHAKLTAVAAVRGDETSDTPPLYWKGRSSEGQVALPELKEFDDAINTALNGDAGNAKTKLESFLGTYPQSPLADEAKETLTLLSENSQP